MTFGELLRSRRKEKDASQKYVAKRSGLSVAYISALENGHRGAPPLQTVVQLARALDADVKKFIAVAERDRKQEAKRKVAYVPTRDLEDAEKEMDFVILTDLPPKLRQLFEKFANDPDRLEALSILESAFEKKSDAVLGVLRALAES